MRLATLALVVALAGCATAHNYPPTLVDGQPDTAQFKVYLGWGGIDSAADQAVREDLEAYKTKNGYRSYAVLDRRWNQIPTYIEYTVRFAR